MRCLSCNCILSSKEATRRGVNSNNFLDLCDRCYSSISDTIEVYDNPLYANDDETSEINEIESH